MSEFNPLVQRVDALLKRHQQQAAAADPLPGVPHDTTLPPIEPGQGFPDVDPPIATAAATPVAEADEADIPVLTEVIDTDLVQAAEILDQDALVARIESSVLEKMLAELDRSLDQRLGRAIGDLLEQTVQGLRVELSVRVREMVREAVATSIAKVLDERARDL